jgi:drug/metabolite transporter (DMT)-like permease
MNSRQNNQKLLLIGSFASVYVIWGSTYLAVRFALSSISPFLLSSFRFLAAGLILLVIAKLSKAVTPSKVEIKNAGLIGILLLVSGNAGVIWAAQYTPSSITALIITIEPVWVVLLLWIKNPTNKPSLISWIGILIGIIGMIILIGPTNLTQVKGLNPYAIAGIIFSSISWAFGSIYSMQLKLPKSSFMSTSIQMLVASCCMFLIASIFGEWQTFSLREINTTSIVSFLYLVLFGSIVAYTSYGYLVKNTTPTIASTHAYVNPIIAVLLGWWIGKEMITNETVLAAFLIILAVVLLIMKPDFKFLSRKIYSFIFIKSDFFYKSLLRFTIKKS